MAKQLDTGVKKKVPRRSPRLATMLNPNESNCSSCDKSDTMEMVECERCQRRHHCQCVGVDETAITMEWMCQNCTENIQRQANISIRSSTSSKRQGRLQLEKLAKEKAIQDKLFEEKSKLAEQQAAVNNEFLQKEYDIRDAMSDSDDEQINQLADKTELVTDWLGQPPEPNQVLDQTRPVANVESLEQSELDRIRSTLGLLDAVDDYQHIEWLGRNILKRPVSQLLEIINTNPVPPQSNQLAQTAISNTPLRSSQSDIHTPAHQSGTNVPPFVLDIMNQPQPKAISARFAGLQSPPPVTIASNTTHWQANQFPTSAPIAPNVTLGQTSQISSITSTSTHTTTNATIATSQLNTVRNYSQNQQQIPNTSTVTQSYSSAAITAPHQLIYSQQQPRYPHQYVPMASYQQPIVSHATQPNLTANSFQQSNFGPNFNTNMGGTGPQPLQGTYNMSNAGSSGQSLNHNKQNVPTRLQLASRQTMPKEYPKFGGDPTKWAIFYSSFVNCTSECGLSNAENLGRLVTCLEKPASDSVKNLLTRPEAVPEIIATLKMLYGRPEASIEARLQTIRTTPPPKMHKMETFIDFAMSVRNVTSEIQSSGLWQYLYDPRSLQELVDKLPYQMRLEWGEIKVSHPNVSLVDLSTWLYRRAQTACAVTMPVRVSKNDNPNNHVNAHSKDNNVGNKSSANIPKRFTNSNERSCGICNKNSHNTLDCRSFTAMPLNDRWESVKRNNLCRICLGSHHTLQCDSKSLCGESGCTAKHHRLLHNSAKTDKTSKADSKKGDNTTKSLHNAHQVNKSAILRRYIPVTLHGPKGSLSVIAFLDDGSDMTLVESWVAQKLGISGEPEDLYLKWTAKIVRKELNSQSIEFKISGTQTTTAKYDIIGARTVKSLNLPSQSLDAEQMKNDFKFIRRLPIESYTEETPKILIGLKDCKLSTPRKIRSGKWNEPIATKTLLGWEIHGNNATSTEITNLNFHSTEDPSSDENLHKLIENFFSQENFGVKAPEHTIEALSDKRACQLLASTTKRIGNKFRTGLLWKYDDVSLPDSLPMAKRRLDSLEKRLQKDPDLAVKFQAKFNEYVKNGYVRKLSAEEIGETTNRTWYLPLFLVTYPKKPGKIRLVWDAAAKVGNISLNSMLLPGPDLLVPLPGVLYRFREKPYTATGDIKEMFHQVEIEPEDQKSQRFLYREPGSSEIDVYTLQVMSFGAACSPSSAQHVKNRNAREFIKKYPKAEEAIRTNTYVDDWLQSFDSELEAERVAKEVKFVHSQGGFEIRNWLSNSEQVSRSLGTISEGEQKLSFEMDEFQTERILGMWWQVKQDTFTYSLRYNSINENILNGTRIPTKREILRTLMSIYDPLGLLAAYLVHLKMILQDIWRAKIGWDQKIPENDPDQLFARWLSWVKHLPDIERINIARHYSTKLVSTNPTRIELHVFVDAGELAYATAAYLRIEDEEGVECSLIGGKTKVAPLRPLSVPRMELQGAVLGARFKNTILLNHTITIQRTIIWCDSSTVLSWLRSDLRKYTQYVGARVCELLETTTPPEWRWIPSNLNIADDATKFKGSFNLEMSDRWFKGPEFLLKSEEHWPTTGDVPDTEEEKRPKYVNVQTVQVVESLPIKFDRFNQWKRTMAFVYRFVNNLRTKLKKPGFDIQYGSLTRKELRDGEIALYRKAQLDDFTPEILQLEEKKVDPKGRRLTVEKASSIYRYSPYLDEKSILRMRGRIDAASNISIDQKMPIILPTKHQITDLVVDDYHRRYRHQNTETVINEIKQKFIIPRLRALLKRIRRNCQHCKNIAVQPNPPEMAPLPIERLASFTRPYTFVGIDYAGPYKIIQFRRSVKRWIVVFTCLTIRAVYIDVVESLTSDSCIMSIRRFIARNGTPSKFFSDCGTPLVGANSELAKEIAKIDHELLNVTFTTCYTQWHFNPPYGQHMGGAWERLIGSMKRTLDKVLPTSSHYPTNETFITALAEVKNILNSRPLTFVSIEPDDSEALTPNHFLKGSSSGNKPPGIFPSPPAALRGNWRYSQQIANEFWKKWVKEYLPMITRRTKWFDDVKPIEVGDQVIIVDEDTPRNTWERGVVFEALESDIDGNIRQVNVRTINGIYKRPVHKLAVLDIERTGAKALTRESLAGGSVTASNES